MSATATAFTMCAACPPDTAPCACCPCARQNFVLTAVATQYNDVLNPSNAKNPEVIELARNLDAIDTFFTALFTTELLVNLYAHWSPNA